MTDNAQTDFHSLKKQLAEIDSAIEEKKAEELKVLVDGFARKLESLGLSVDTAAKQLKGYGRKPVPRSNGMRQSNDEFVLYANPADPKQTWGGIGRKPGWVNEFLANGGSLERLKV